MKMEDTLSKKHTKNGMTFFRGTQTEKGASSTRADCGNALSALAAGTLSRKNKRQRLEIAFALLRDAGPPGGALRFSLTAASNSTAMASNSGLGPLQRNSSTSLKRGMSVRSVANLRKSS